MELHELIKLQKEFDLGHETDFNWGEQITSQNLQLLQFLTIALTGEVGEMANLIKKVIRGDKEFSALKNNITDELTDIFIYVLKLSYQMDVDLERSYLEKLKINKRRFKKFKK